MKIIKHYSYAVTICVFTIWFGLGLLERKPNVMDRVILFEPSWDMLIGTLMIVLPIIKLLSLYLPYRKLRKFSLMSIFLLWLVLTWAYVNNPIPNDGYKISSLVAAICLLELYRGDYAG